MNKTTLILIGLLIAGGALVFFYSNDKDPEKMEGALNEEETVEEIIIPEEEEIIIRKEKVGTLSGEITLISGNCMPMVCDEPPCQSSCLREGVARDIHIREVATSEKMEGVYLSDKPKLIKKGTSNADGSYSVILPVGKYSIFVEDNGKEYCNSWDGEGNACMVEIKEEQRAKHSFQLNYAVW